MTFDTAQHPRDDSGKFAEKLGSAPEVGLGVDAIADLAWEEANAKRGVLGALEKRRTASHIRSYLPTAEKVFVEWFDGDGPDDGYFSIAYIQDADGEQLFEVYEDSVPPEVERSIVNSAMSLGHNDLDDQEEFSFDLPSESHDLVAVTRAADEYVKALNVAKAAERTRLTKNVRERFPDAQRVVIDFVDTTEADNVPTLLHITDKNNDVIWELEYDPQDFQGTVYSSVPALADEALPLYQDNRSTGYIELDPS